MKLKLILLGVLFLSLFPLTGRGQLLDNKATGTTIQAKDIPFAKLYGSKEWKTTIEHWIASHLYTSNSAANFAEKFVPEAETALRNSFQENPRVALLLAIDLISFMEQFGIDPVAEKIAVCASQLGLKHDTIDRIVTAAGLPGRPAPPLKGVKDLKNTLLVFYESGCENCDALVDELIKNYSILQKKNKKIVSVSADIEESIFLSHSKKFLWKDKLCDYEGLDGDPFIRYGVTATPTIYVIDEKGMVSGRYARLQDVPM